MTEEQRITKLEQARVSMEETVIVMTEIQSRQAYSIKELAQRQDEWNLRMTQSREEFDRRGAIIDQRIQALVSAIGEFIRTNGRETV